MHEKRLNNMYQLGFIYQVLQLRHGLSLANCLCRSTGHPELH
jgi:hypothetical protein